MGRQAIQKWHSDLFQWWHPENSIHKVDGNAPHLIGTAGNELWATGEWSDTGQGKNGEPLPIKGYWLCIYVREGDDWKIRVMGGNATRTVSYSSTRVLRHNRPQRRPQLPALAANEIATDAGSKQ